MKVLVVVDMQHDFVDGALGTSEAKQIVENVKKKVELYWSVGDKVIRTPPIIYRHKRVETYR